MQRRWKQRGVHYQNPVPDMVLICAALVLSMFAMPLAITLVLIDGLKKTDPDTEID